MVHSEIPIVHYDNLRMAIREEADEKNIPVSGDIEITSRCNLRCVHCYVRDMYNSEELSYKEICNILDQIADAGCLWLLFTGGEPLVRPDFKDIYQYAKKKGFIIFVLSNGTLLTPSMVDFLAKLPPYVLDITMYGYTAETYEKMTGVPGSHEKFMNGIKLALDRKLPLELKSVITTINAHEFVDMYRFAKRLGVKFRYDAYITRNKDRSAEPLKYRLTPEEILALDLAIPEDIEPRAVDIKKSFITRPKTDNLYVCGAGKHSFFITAEGKLNLCTMSAKPGYDLHTGKFIDGFKQFSEIINTKHTRETECQTCPAINLCGHCPTYCELENGDPEEKDEFQCQLTKLRVETFLHKDIAAPE